MKPPAISILTLNSLSSNSFDIVSLSPTHTSSAAFHRSEPLVRVGELFSQCPKIASPYCIRIRICSKPSRSPHPLLSSRHGQVCAAVQRRLAHGLPHEFQPRPSSQQRLHENCPGPCCRGCAGASSCSGSGLALLFLGACVRAGNAPVARGAAGGSFYERVGKWKEFLGG